MRARGTAGSRCPSRAPAACSGRRSPCSTSKATASRELIVAAALPDGIRLLPFAAANGELEPGEPIDLDGAGGPGDPVEVSVRLGRAAGG